MSLENEAIVPNSGQIQSEELNNREFDSNLDQYSSDSVEHIILYLINQIECQNQFKTNEISNENLIEDQQLSTPLNQFEESSLDCEQMSQTDYFLDIQMVPNIGAIREETNHCNQLQIVPQMQSESNISSQSSDDSVIDDPKAIQMNTNFLNTGLDPIKKRKFVKHPIKVGLNKRQRVPHLHEVITN